MAKKKQAQYSGIGGQAVLEGVMMKNKEKYAVAVRKPDGEIDLQVEEYKGVCGGTGFVKIPFIRGVFAFIDSLILGMRVTMHSASFYEEEDGEAEAGKSSGSKSDDIMMGLTVALSVIIAVALFMLLPFFISDLLGKHIRNASIIAILEGVLRILIFVGYIVAISLMKDIRRLYMYHGAEHKCINCIERGRPLTVKNVMRSSRQHKRCGTSFLLFVVLVSVIVFFFIRVDNMVLKLVIRLLLVPVIAGISYEIIRLAGRSDNLIIRMISAPGMWMQRLTTKEPDEEMVQVAIASVEAVFDWEDYIRKTFDYRVEEDFEEEASFAYESEEQEAAFAYEAQEQEEAIFAYEMEEQEEVSFAYGMEEQEEATFVNETEEQEEAAFAYEIEKQEEAIFVNEVEEQEEATFAFELEENTQGENLFVYEIEKQEN